MLRRSLLPCLLLCLPVVSEAAVGQDATTRTTRDAQVLDVRGPGEVDIGDDTAARHVPTGLIFPSRLLEVPRLDVYSYDEAARDISAGYNHLPSGLVLTLYIYPMPRGTTLEQVAERAAQDIRRETPAMEPLTDGVNENDPAISPPAKGPMIFRMFATNEPAGGFPVPITSVLAVAELAEKGGDDERYLLKIRATYPSERMTSNSNRLGGMLRAWRSANGFEDAPATQPATRPAPTANELRDAVAALRNSDVKFDHNCFIGTNPWPVGDEAKRRQWLVLSAGPDAIDPLLAALDDPDRFIVAHVLLTYVTRYHDLFGQRGMGHYNGLTISFEPWGEVQAPDAVRHQVIAAWKDWRAGYDLPTIRRIIAEEDARQEQWRNANMPFSVPTEPLQWDSAWRRMKAAVDAE